MSEELQKLIEDLLAILDADECPEVYNYLADILSEDQGGTGTDAEQPGLAMQIVDRLNDMDPLPEEVWDFVRDVLELEVQNGNDDAMNELGAMYYEGSVCEQDYAKAVQYYQMAAAHGNRLAQENLGYCFYYGRSVPVDYEKAFHYFALGAFDGQLVSLYKIGDMYANGLYVEKNEKEAFAIYMRCLNSMTDESAGTAAGPVFLRLGNAYLYGKGTEVDLEKALISYQRAELYLYDMVKDGDSMYWKSLEAAIEGQAKAREKRAAELSAGGWSIT